MMPSQTVGMVWKNLTPVSGRPKTISRITTIAGIARNTSQ